MSRGPMDQAPDYAELHCLSNFTFLRGASHPEHLVDRAARLGYRALAITDECSVAGAPRAHLYNRKPVEDDRPVIQLIIGSEFRLTCGLRFVALATNRQGYGKLSRLITRGRRAAEKGTYTLERADVASLLGQCLLLWLPGEPAEAEQGAWLKTHFPGDVWIAVELLRQGADRKRLETLTCLGRELALPLVASGDVHMHSRKSQPLQDAMTAIRLNVPLAEAGSRLYANGERHLRERVRLAKFYPRELLAETLVIAQRCTFSLGELKYEYPHELVPQGTTPETYLRTLVEEGARERWPRGIPAEHRSTIERELKIIHELQYEPYFLTVQDIVKEARRLGILCQGRGSAANSLVCYCLYVTSVDPERGAGLLFERFLSRERREPPDIDIDFEHERREEVIQYVYRKYGRERAALAATVIRYRPRSALRDLGKAFGLDPLQIQRLAGAMQWWDGEEITDARVREAGYDPHNVVIQRILILAKQLIDFPRHLSQHVGGFVISEGLLEELVPIENATMANRTVVQWDKDDLNDLGLLKVDLLALGMLTAIRKALDLINAYRGTQWHFGGLPPERPEVYEMIQRADTVGVFQIESRAQMAMLPRLKPKEFYDLIVEVAIVRPGPIQGDMVHPYLRRREGTEPVSYPNDDVKKVLERTLGVPIFQEQVMQLAIVAAGFTYDESDALRRAMAAWKRRGGLEKFRDKLLSGMRERNYDEEFAQRIFKQMLGFGEYGFPESHAASFALLVYDSSWIKHHEPAAFACALLNSQPMGFYAPAQLVRDARNHEVEVRPVDVNASSYECTLERTEGKQPALRLGLCLVKSLSKAGAERLVAARGEQLFASVQDLMERASLDRGDLEALAAADAFAGLSGNRHLAFWEVAGVEKSLPLAPRSTRSSRLEEGHPLLPAPTEGQGIVADYHSVGLTLGRHPLALLRERLQKEQLITAAELQTAEPGGIIRTAGIVLMRQRPQSASGVTFVTIEDETGQVNLLVWESIGEQQRRPLLESRLLEVHGELQREKGIVHVIARRLIDRSRLLGELATRSRDFH